MQSYICPACQKTFQAKPNARTGKLKTCSRACFYIAMVTPPEIRFWKKVTKTDSCWIWTGNITSKYGHGSFMVSSKPKIVVPAHRYSYELVYGSVPKHLEVCHDCPGGDCASCVNPDHLFISTHKGNMEDAAKKKRMIGHQGEANGSSKLHEEQVLQIRNLYLKKRTQTSLAEQFGVSQTTIWHILQGHSWKHVLPKVEQLIML